MTRAHAKESTLRIFELLQKDGDSLGPDAVSLDHDAEGTHPLCTPRTPLTEIRTDLVVQVRLHGRHVVQASIDLFSGRLELKALGEASTTKENRMRSVADKANESRQLIVESLLRIRSSVSLWPPFDAMSSLTLCADDHG